MDKLRIGFMQGRLSPMDDGKIQSFPWANWRQEFSMARAAGFDTMEWTLDYERLYENPLMAIEGQESIRSLCKLHSFSIPSLTGDCFMQAPFWKAEAEIRGTLQEDFIAVARACNAVGIRIIVIPLVDGGRIESRDEEDRVVLFLENLSEFLAAHGLRVAFESDFPPAELARFIERLPSALFGINYDIGNSAALGYRPQEELSAYGDRVFNVHVKDRALRGTTVPLGMGNADFAAVFGALRRCRYEGNFILQTARASDADHTTPLVRYRDQTAGWIREYNLG